MLTKPDATTLVFDYGHFLQYVRWCQYVYKMIVNSLEMTGVGNLFVLLGRFRESRKQMRIEARFRIQAPHSGRWQNTSTTNDYATQTCLQPPADQRGGHRLP